MLDLLKFSISAKNNTGGAFAEVKKELGGVKGMMASVSDQAKRTGKSMSKIGAGMSLAVTAPLLGLGKQMTSLYDTQVQAEQAVATAITSTGGAAGKTLQDLKGLASGLQSLTTYGDEDILRNVTAPLLTFTKIQDEVFDRAQSNVLDMATLLKTDLKSASILVGKALNDPIKGVSALGKSGVQFSEDQKGMIKSLVETGDVAGAQLLVLQELETQFKGQAEAAANAPLGQWVQLGNLVGDVKEQLGEQIVPFLKPLAENIKTAVTWFAELSPEVKRNIVVVGGLAAAVGPLVAGLGLMVMSVGAVGGAFATVGALLLANPLFAAIAVIAGGAYLIYRNWKGISGWFAGVTGGIKAAGSDFSAFMAKIFGADQQAARDAFEIVWDSFPNIIRDSFQAMQNIADLGVADISRLLNNFTPAGIFRNTWGDIGTWFSSKWEEVRSNTDISWAAIKANLTANYSPEALIYSAWRGVGSWFSGRAEDVAQGFRDIWDSVSSETLTWPEKMMQVGRDTIGGLVKGLLDVPLTPAAVAKKIGQSMIGSIKDILKSKSPSRVFMDIGKDVVDGLAIGVADNAQTAIGEMAQLGKTLTDEAQRSTSMLGKFRDGAKGVFSSVLTGSQSFKGALSGVLSGIGSNLINSGMDQLFDAIWPFAKGGVISSGSVVPFAKGGVVNSPTLFGMSGNNTGLMGEAGPEAIMPLTRGSDGSLGVRAEYSTRGSSVMQPQKLDVRITMDPSTGALGAIVFDTAGRAIAQAAPTIIRDSVDAAGRRMAQTTGYGAPA